MPRLTRFSGALRRCTAFLLYVCAWATFPPAYADQQTPAEPQSFAAAARRAIAHGRPDDAEALAKQKPATDAAAAGVLGQLAAMRGRYEEAIALLEPAAAKEPGSEAAL
jgi:tetratricopeptide (TPR) repeat protein